uniref:TatD related DNase n=1 Tax=Fibrocapsa japonica TaxID=94617 RepID=A0A7S2UWP9_9STRA|mmetsp:Transcript_17369/g.25369  ORF Transcript_17369/g.25369 Transcript_17369/m.25369 type:complete len:280 (+) Transcript_17369:114-953(+)
MNVSSSYLSSGGGLSVFDCHAHMTDTEFSNDLENVLEMCNATGVQGLVCVSSGVHDSEKVLQLGSKHPSVIPSVGLHPEFANISDLPTIITQITQYHDQLASVGEVGLDYSPHILGEGEAEERKAIQREVFSQQVLKAVELDLPLNVHSRAAGHHTLDLLRELGATRVVMHAFDGRAHYAERAVSESGYYFSVPPCIVRSPQLQKLVRRLPLDHLLLESDSPALAPVKGERNCPSNIIVSCEEIAKIKQVSVQEVAAITYANAMKLLNIPETFQQTIIN